MKTKLTELKKGFNLSIIIILMLIAAGLSMFLIFNEKSNFDYETNKLSYYEHRAPVQYSLVKINESAEFLTYKLIYESKSFMKQPAQIHSLLYVPKSDSVSLPAILFLPGGGVSKENEPIAVEIAKLGYVVLVIDQRGVGETLGFYPSFEEDKLLFEKKQESIQHLGVYDALIGLDILRNIDYVDKDSIIIGGSSMGGRYAMIAAALDNKIEKVIIISSSGFHIESTQYATDSYFLSIDPDRYVADIAPAKLVMIHSENDALISIVDANYTYSLALQPKEFYVVNGDSHGYSEEMLQVLKEELALIK
jgi:uncharacterized protein